MSFEAESLDFMSEERWIDFSLDVVGFLGFADGAMKRGNPFAHDGGDTIADWATTAVEFEGGSGEKAAAGKELCLDVAQPAVDQAPETRQAFGGPQSGNGDFVDEDLAGGIDCRQLEVFFGAKVGEETALAHLQGFRQTANGEAFQTLQGGDIDGAAEDGFASAKAAGLAA